MTPAWVMLIISALLLSGCSATRGASSSSPPKVKPSRASTNSSHSAPLRHCVAGPAECPSASADSSKTTAVALPPSVPLTSVALRKSRLTVRGRLPGGVEFQPLAVVNPHLVVGLTIDLDLVEHHGDPGCLALVAVDPNASTRVAETIHTEPTTKTCPFGVTTDGQWLVWVEDASDLLGAPAWTLYGYNLATRERHVIAQHPVDKRGQPVPTQQLSPSLSHGLVVWSQGNLTEPIGHDADTYVATVDGSAQTRRIPDSADAHIQWPMLSYVKLRNAGRPTLHQLETENLETHVTRAVPGAVNPSFTACGRSWCFWATSGADATAPRSAFVSHPDGSALRQVVDQGIAQFPAIPTDRFVLWDGYNDGSLLYDTQRARIIQVTNPPSAFISNGYLLWMHATGTTAYGADWIMLPLSAIR